jgi:hypothetical protein
MQGRDFKPVEPEPDGPKRSLFVRILEFLEEPWPPQEPVYRSAPYGRPPQYIRRARPRVYASSPCGCVGCSVPLLMTLAAVAAALVAILR